MLSVLRVAGRRVIIVLTILNIELAGDFLGLAGLLRTVVQNGPDWLSAIIDFFMLKGVLAFTTFLLGMIVADWAIRYDERVRGRYGRVPASWLVLNVLLTRWSIRHRRTLGRLVDVRRALMRANSLLTRADFGFPPLPTTDPNDVAGMAATRRYLDALGWFILTDRDEARTRANAMAAAHGP